MNIKQLESVLEISRCGSMRQAAQNLYVTQPALSAAVKQLEQELDYAIFLRKPSGMTLTPEGRLLLQSAQRMVEEAQRIRHIPRLTAGTPIPGLRKGLCSHDVADGHPGPEVKGR